MLSVGTGRLVRVPVNWAGSATLSGLVTIVAFGLALGALTVAAPAGAEPTTTWAAVPSSTPPVAGSPAPPPQSTAVPGGTGAALGSLVMGIESPQAGQQLHTDRDFLIVGYALDKSANVNQGVQGSGIDRVQLFMDIPPDATPMADADLGFSDASAATFGIQFADSGFRLMFHPGDFPAGSHNLYVLAHSAVTGEQIAMLFWISITIEPTGGRHVAAAAETGRASCRERV